MTKDAFGPLANSIVREHQVINVAGEFPPIEGIMDRARAEILKWAQKKSGGQFPTEAFAGRAFELFPAGRSSIAVEVDLSQIHAWALRQEDPDKTKAGRIWTSEAILWRAPDGPPKFAARLIVGSSEIELEIEPAAPSYIRQLVDTFGLTSGRHELSSKPWYIRDVETTDALFDLIEAPERRLPVVVNSIIEVPNIRSRIDLEKLAANLCGFAHVVGISTETSWRLTDRFGKQLSVFDHGLRIYMPGFNEDADPYAHPLWVGTRLGTVEAAAAVSRQIRIQLAQFSTRAIRTGVDIYPFAQLLSISRTEQYRLAKRGDNPAEQLSAAEQQVNALKKELAEAKTLQEYAFDEESKARNRAEEAESRERNATAQIQTLLQRLSEASAAPDRLESLPEKWADFEAWCDQWLVGHIALTGVAKRGCKKASFGDVKQVARCLIWIADVCRVRFQQGGGSVRDELVEHGIRNAPCGGDKFTFDWQSRQLTAEWHIKTGGNTRAPENCLRIYYAWDADSQQIIIADMPGHRKTGAS